MCDSFLRNYDTFLPPSKDTVNLLQGINDFQNKTLHNMSDIWYRLTLKTKKGDIVLLGGDFVLACSDCCFTEDVGCKRSKNSNDEVLIDLMVKKLHEGVKIIILEDLFFVEKLYTDEKPQYDFITTRLKQNSNGNFFHYTIPTNHNISLHSKILTFFFLSEDKPYLVSSLGSFNPSYPESRTNEIGLIVTGDVNNPLIQAIGSYMWVISNYIYTIYNRENWGNDEPLVIMKKYFKVENNYKKDISTNIIFCGKNFCPNTLDRIMFSEKNVKFRIGGEPTIVFRNFDYGMNLIKNLFRNSKKFVKIGIMQGVFEQLPYCKIKKCKDKIKFDTLLFNEELMSFLKKGKGLYVIQKIPKKLNKDGTFGPFGGLWNWLKSNGNNCEGNCVETPSKKGFHGPTVIKNNPVSFRWYKSPLHWKMYLSDNEIIQSTQHPIEMYYYSGNENIKTSMGYELSIKNCPKLIAYYNNLYNFYWKNYTKKTEFDKYSPSILPCSSPKDENNCCKIDKIKCASSCYPSGQGPLLTYNFQNGECVKTNVNPQFYNKKECENQLELKSINKTSNIIIIISLIFVLLLLFIILYVLFK